MRKLFLITFICLALALPALGDDGFDIITWEKSYNGFVLATENDQNNNVLVLISKRNVETYGDNIYSILMEWQEDGQFYINEPVFVTSLDRENEKTNLTYHPGLKNCLLTWISRNDRRNYILNGMLLDLDGKAISAPREFLSGEKATIFDCVIAPIEKKIKGAPRKAEFVVMYKGYYLIDYFRPGLWTFFLDKKGKPTGKVVSSLSDMPVVYLGSILAHDTGFLLLATTFRYRYGETFLYSFAGSGKLTKEIRMDGFELNDQFHSNLTRLPKGNILLSIYGRDRDGSWEEAVYNKIITPAGKDVTQYKKAFADNLRYLKTILSTDGKKTWQTYIDTSYDLFAGNVSTSNAMVQKIKHRPLNSNWKYSYYFEPGWAIVPVGDTGNFILITLQEEIAGDGETFTLRGYLQK